MSAFNLKALLHSRRGEDLDLWARTINPQFVRVLRTIGFDRTWSRAEGAYLYDVDGTRYLDLLGGFGMYAVGRNNPRIRVALAEALELETPGMLAMGTTLLPAESSGACSRARAPSRSRRR
jgi:ornithine--oxo-acid transaminase